MSSVRYKLVAYRKLAGVVTQQPISTMWPKWESDEEARVGLADAVEHDSNLGWRVFKVTTTELQP